jgi:hypothetical protein
LAVVVVVVYELNETSIDVAEHGIVVVVVVETSQSKYASKSNMLQGFVVDVVVTQVPELNKSLHKSGQIP